MLRVIDARSGRVLQRGPCHDGAKAAKVVFVADDDKLLTTGANKASRRQLAIWDRVGSVSFAVMWTKACFNPSLNRLIVRSLHC